ncbi:hypothetical protein O9993_23350 [Vibrio lentus]|nr:hypothetical protein [Vibrio lentus]
MPNFFTASFHYGYGGDGTASTPLPINSWLALLTDPAQVALSMTAEQQVITLGTSGTGSVMNQGQLQTGDHITQLAFEFNIIGGPQVDSHGIHGATFLRPYGVLMKKMNFMHGSPVI